MLSKEQKAQLLERVRAALGGYDYPLLVLAPKGVVQEVLNGFGEPIEGWREALCAAGIPCSTVAP